MPDARGRQQIEHPTHHQVTEFRQTRMVQLIETHLNLDVPTYLKQRYWEDNATYQDIADELGVHSGTVGVWMRQLGWTTRQMARAAVEAGLLGDSPYTLIKKSTRRDTPADLLQKPATQQCTVIGGTSTV